MILAFILSENVQVQIILAITTVLVLYLKSRVTDQKVDGVAAKQGTLAGKQGELADRQTELTTKVDGNLEKFLALLESNTVTRIDAARARGKLDGKAEGQQEADRLARERIAAAADLAAAKLAPAEPLTPLPGATPGTVIGVLKGGNDMRDRNIVAPVAEGEKKGGAQP